MGLIIEVKGREVIDSRGNPTIEADVVLESGVIGRASVPSGASTGAKEAIELRDEGDKGRYNGKGVQTAVNNINTEIYECIVGLESSRQREIDQRLIDLDGTESKGRLGANAMLAVSLATARASSLHSGIPLYQYIGGVGSNVLPVPLMNVINGGAHANNKLDIQEFMIVPFGFTTFSDSLRCGIEVFQCLKNIIDSRGLSTTVGDEGGFAPNIDSNETVLDLMTDAVKEAGYKIPEEVGFALDCASSEFFKDGNYHLSLEDKSFSSTDFISYLEKLVDQYPIFSVEDGLDENDIEGWKTLTKKIGSRVQLVGDDLFVTNTKIISSGIVDGIANAVLIKTNQIGTLTETLAAIEMAKKAGYGTIISHRSGETEDSFIADLSVGTNALQIKTGSLSRSDRMAKYNQLLRIESELGGMASFGGKEPFKNV